MSTTSSYIRDLFRGVSHGWTQTAIDRLDQTVEMLAQSLRADFCALFFCPAPLESHVPIAIRNLSLTAVESVEDLEKAMNVKVATSAVDSHRRILLQQFALANGFDDFDIVEQNSESGVCLTMISFFRTSKIQLEPGHDLAVEASLKGILAFLEYMQQVVTVDGFSGPLENLLALFELDTGSLEITGVIEEIVYRGARILPSGNTSVICRQGSDGPFEVVRSSQADENKVEQILRLLVEKSVRLPQDTKPELVSEAAWDGKNSLVIARLLKEADSEYFLVSSFDLDTNHQNSNLELVALFCHISRSVLENVRALQQLKRSHRTLKKASSRMASVEALAAVTDMTSGVAHEFNNLIGGIVGRVQLMKIKATDDKLVRDLEKLERSALEGAEVVRCIQQFTSRARCKNPKKFNLTELVIHCVEGEDSEWRKLAEERQVEVVIESSEEKAVAEGNSSDVMVAINHLITNAVEHSPEGQLVTVKLETTDNVLRVSVFDSGPGIPEELQGKLFYPFYSTKQSRGAGLGLAIVFGVAIRHGGQVGVESETGRGTTFWLEIARTEGLQDEDITDKHKKATGSLSILVVDDDRQIREILCDMLTIEGHLPVACEDGFKALEAIGKSNFDMMITDLGMPGMSGLDLAGMVHESHPETAIAMITGWGTQLDPDEIALRGIRTLLSKPFHLKDIKNLVIELQSS